MKLVLFAIGALIVGCSTHHVRMNVAQTNGASTYTCEVIERGSSAIRCSPATTAVPSDQNRSGTTFFNLPKECDRFSQIVVNDADGDHPTLTVTCAAPAPTPACTNMPD